MKINKEILEICSKNLLIDFNEEEKEILYNELLKIVENMENIKSIDLTNVEPTDYLITKNNSFRKDDDNSYENNEHLKSLKDFKNNLLKV